MIPLRVFLVLAAATLALTACRKPQIEAYRVPKESESREASARASAPALAGNGNAPAAPDMAATPVATASGAGLAWTAPSHWKAKPGSAMRKGSYAISDEGGAEADLSITAFPGDVGGDLANLNRWRGQIQLPPIDQAEFDSATAHVDVNGLHMTFADIAGTGANPQRILGAMVPFNGATWFFKLMGPAPVVAKEKEAFLAFLQTVKPIEGAAK